MTIKNGKEFDERLYLISIETYPEGIRRLIKQLILDLLGDDFDGQNNPMLNEYTRGYNTAKAEIRAIVKGDKE